MLPFNLHYFNLWAVRFQRAFSFVHCWMKHSSSAFLSSPAATETPCSSSHLIFVTLRYSGSVKDELRCGDSLEDRERSAERRDGVRLEKPVECFQFWTLTKEKMYQIIVFLINYRPSSVVEGFIQKMHSWKYLHTTAYSLTTVSCHLFCFLAFLKCPHFQMSSSSIKKSHFIVSRCAETCHFLQAKWCSPLWTEKTPPQNLS